MQAIFDMFDERIEEINTYYISLEKLQELQVSSEIHHEYTSDEFLKILKANALLMIYNLVESTVMGGILEIYDKFKQEGLTYNTVRKEIKDIWFSYKFKQVYKESAHYYSYKDKALEIVNAVILGETIELDRKAADISGNLDAQQIRNVCKDHGIRFTTEESCNGGAVLEAVKDRRNDLAHGTLSFAECGRDYTLNDLEEIKDQTVTFLKGLLDGMKIYYDERQYKL